MRVVRAACPHGARVPVLHRRHPRGAVAAAVHDRGSGGRAATSARRGHRPDRIRTGDEVTTIGYVMHLCPRCQLFPTYQMVEQGAGKDGMRTVLALERFTLRVAQLSRRGLL